jgi:hypothetical protein
LSNLEHGSEAILLGFYANEQPLLLSSQSCKKVACRVMKCIH